MNYHLRVDKIPLLATWRVYVDAATLDTNPSATASIGLVCTYQATAKDGTYEDQERIHDMRAVTINGSSISNNVAEMRAVLYGYQYVERYLCGIVTLLSDSRYAIESVNNAHMYDDTSLTWSNILAHRQHSAVDLEWRKRDTPYMKLADFLALLSVASGEEYHWGKPEEHRTVLNAFSTYKPRG